MFCPKCGKKVDDSDAFCRSCGRTLSTEKPGLTGIAPPSVGAGAGGVGRGVEPTKTSSGAALIIRVVVLLFVLGFTISERGWIQDAADEIGGYDAALKEEEKDAGQASREAAISGGGLTNTEVLNKLAKAANPALHHAASRTTERGAEPVEAVQARGYKDEDGVYQARRADDGEALIQLNAINEDLIVLVPDCQTADSAFKLEIDKSLRLDEYELSNLMGRAEAKAFHNRVVEQGCF